MSDYGSDAPPPDTFGDDRPSDNENALDDTAPESNEPASVLPVTTPMDDSDDDSLLSEVDEAQFADFDATAVQIAPDLETLNRTIKAKKRKRPEGDDATKPKKRKEGTREKIKKNRRKVDSDDGFSGGEEIEGKRSRKSKPGVDGQKEKKKRPVEDEINDEDLPPEERRRRALDRAMDAALKKSTSRRIRKGEIVCLRFLLTSSTHSLTTNRILKPWLIKRSTTCANE
jgi:transcription factor SPN1